MPTPYGSGQPPFPYSDFHGGFNSLQAPSLLTDNEARDLLNVQGTTAGAIVKRAGLVTFASPAQALTSLFALESVSPVVLLGAGGTSLYSISTAGAVTSIGTGFTSGKNWSFASAPVVSGRGPAYMMNGTDTPQYWSGSGSVAGWTNASGGVGVPNGTMMAYNQNQLFVSGVAANPSRLYWSAIADPTNWDAASLTGAGSMDFDPNDGQSISGIGVVGPYLLVAKPRKLWVLVNPATASARKISDNVGVASHRSIASGPEGTYFLAEDRGVYVTNGTKLTPISDKIQPTIDGFQALRSQAAGAYFGAHYYLSVPLNSTTNDTVLDYDAKLTSWWKHGFGSNQFAIWHPTAGVSGLYSAKATGAIVDQCFAANVWTDNGANMPWYWRGPWQSPTFYRRRRFPTTWERKRLRQVRVEGYGTVDFSLAKDYAGAESLVRSNIFAATSSGVFAAADGSTFAANDGSLFGSGSVQLARVYSLGTAKDWSLVFGSTSSTPDAVLQYILLLTDRRDLTQS